MNYLFEPIQYIIHVVEQNVLYNRRIVVREVRKERSDARDDVTGGWHNHHWFQQRSLLVKIEGFSLERVALWLLKEEEEQKKKSKLSVWIFSHLDINISAIDDENCRILCTISHQLSSNRCCFIINNFSSCDVIETKVVWCKAFG